MTEQQTALYPDKMEERWAPLTLKSWVNWGQKMEEGWDKDKTKQSRFLDSESWKYYNWNTFWWDQLNFFSLFNWISTQTSTLILLAINVNLLYLFLLECNQCLTWLQVISLCYQWIIQYIYLYVKEVMCSDKLTENYHPKLQFPSTLWSFIVSLSSLCWFYDSL